MKTQSPIGALLATCTLLFHNAYSVFANRSLAGAKRVASCQQPREVWRETLRWVWTALSERVKLLFDPTLELAALLLLLPTIERVVELLNRPDVPSDSYAQDELLGGPDPMLPISTMGCWRSSR